MIAVSTVKKEFQLRVFQESYPRIETCLKYISQDQLWQAPNENMTSIGCLIKHLLGNMSQWVYAGVLQQPYVRDRNAEFVPEPERSKKEILEQMNNIRIKIEQALLKLTAERLEERLEIQGFETTGFSAITHVIEHFSYHTGQISLLTKLYQNVDLAYYAGYKLD